ncbi:MAG: sulfotransferase domain-containing protein [Parachlamydiaceae bacterium]
MIDLNLLIVFIFSTLSLSAVDFVLFTQPKTGTHLLTPILAELTGKAPYCPRKYMKDNVVKNQNQPIHVIYLEQGCPCSIEAVNKIWEINAQQGSFLHFHTPYSQELENDLKEKKMVVFFVKRDPRDQIVSLLNHYKKYGFLDKKLEQIPSDDQRLLFMIQKRLKRSLLFFNGWLSSPICCVLDFAKLMGSHGGVAENADAIDEMKKMATILELHLSDDQLKEIYLHHFGKSGGFFKGKVGAWQDYFLEEHKVEVKKEIGLLLIELGFEKDLNW